MPETPTPQKPVEPRPSGRRRLRDALVRPGRPQVVVAVLLAIVASRLGLGAGNWLSKVRR